MPVPLIAWAILGAVGVGVTGWAAREAGDAADSATKLVKWGTAAGAVYVSYRALQASGALK
ncbi:hypothetical protein G5B38_02325 [Pseudohalocynthiibacter aestuariivivens]|nr:hypothetical protein [Pseudohalocynthiibacter aestuariivivens]QIE44455.1 hypothetical protein G5B38_02325 [Pseudohalocynthiibacter aestuariivivens]